MDLVPELVISGPYLFEILYRNLAFLLIYT